MPIDMKIFPSGAKISRATLKPLTRASETKMSSTSARALAPSKRPRASTDVPASPWGTAASAGASSLGSGFRYVK